MRGPAEVKHRLVVDASVSATWVLPDESSADSEALLRDIEAGRLGLVEPSLWPYEMLNIIKSAVKARRLEEGAAKESLHLISELPVEWSALDPVSAPVVLETAIRHDLSVYDAAYFVLANLQGLCLVTADKDLLALKTKFHWIKHPSEELFKRKY